MCEVFYQFFEDLQFCFVEIVDFVVVLIDKVMCVFVISDVVFVEEVIVDDVKIDEFVVVFDEQVIEIFVCQQLVVCDFCIVVMVLCVSVFFECMGDMLEYIVQFVCFCFFECVILKGFKGMFVKMGEFDVEVVCILFELLCMQDLCFVDVICNVDDDVDELYVIVFEKVFSDNWKGEVMVIVDVMFVSCYYECFVDYVVVVVKKVVYLVMGDWVVEEEDIFFVVEQQGLEYLYFGYV